jgi:copper(I)-binding protein
MDRAAAAVASPLASTRIESTKDHFMTYIRKRTLLAVAVALAAFTHPALAQKEVQIQVEGAWVRATVPGQRGTGGFLKIRSTDPIRLIGVSSPVAGVAELHEMKLEDGVMRMRPLPGLDIPAGTPVELKPGGNHLMLMDLKQPLARGSSVPVTLHLRNSAGQISKLDLSVPVTDRAPGAPAPSASGHKH